MKITNKIIEFISRQDYSPMTKEELALEFQLEISEYRIFFKILDDLIKDGVLIKSKKDKYLLPSMENIYKGSLQGNKSGYTFFIEENKKIKDIYIAKENLNGAKHKDEVLVRIIKEATENRHAEGEVIEILNAISTTIIGTFKSSKNFGFVIPDDSRYGFDIFISKGDKNGAKNNDKVVVKFKNEKNKGKNPEGTIISVIGNRDDIGVDISSIVLEYQIPHEFSSKILDRADNIPKNIRSEEIKSRVDYRNLFTVTIDGSDAKDFDDAISIEKKDDNFILYVHIADVAHYVDKGSAIDKEAYRRGNSVYLLDRVIPMLPEQLSNGICSLNPGEDRLAMTVKMEINEKGKVVDYKFFESVINSKFRLIYDDVSNLLENISDKYNYNTLTENLKLMEDLFKVLNLKRKNRGSIDFNFIEPKIVLDNEGKVVDIQKEERRVANRIIEEFMLVTNETVGSHFGFLEEPFIYRVHISPSREKTEEFLRIIKKFGYIIKGKELYSKDYQKILDEIKNKPEEMLISTLMLRSFAKAEYSLEPDIHFGLSSMFYCHFTSPIRRYPDLFIHRILKNWIHGKENTSNYKMYLKMIDETAKHCSITERRAEEAGYEVNDMKMAEFMEQKIGEKFTGLISTLTNFGIFVQLENGIEGLVRYSNMRDDYYNFNEESYLVIGQKRDRVFSLGQKVTVKVINASRSRREIDFEII